LRIYNLFLLSFESGQTEYCRQYYVKQYRGHLFDIKWRMASKSRLFSTARTVRPAGDNGVSFLN